MLDIVGKDFTHFEWSRPNAWPISKYAQNYIIGFLGALTLRLYCYPVRQGNNVKILLITLEKEEENIFMFILQPMNFNNLILRTMDMPNKCKLL